MTTQDVERLIAAHERIMAALKNNEPRAAAGILCGELKWLLYENGSFWADVGAAAGTLEEHRNRGRAVLNNIGRLIDAEESIFEKLKIDRSRTEPILAYVYAGLPQVGEGLEDPSPRALANLKQHLGKATELVCGADRSAFGRARDWLMSWKGARIFAGAAVAAADVVYAITTPDGGTTSWVSVTLGTNVMLGDIKGIIETFKPSA